MMAASSGDFEEWLGTKLQALNTDQEIFGGYIKGILDTNDSNDEKLEALEGILVEVSEDEVSALCKEILAKWTLYEHEQKQKASEVKADDFDTKLAVIMVEQAKSVVQNKRHVEGDKNYRDAILAQYSQVSDNEDDFADDPGGDDNESAAVGNSSDLLVRNTNVESVIKAEREKRDKAKAEVEKKKALDKASREKQKQLQQERKDKEKKRTQKGEKRR